VRTHGEFPVLALWPYGPADRDIARPDHVAIVRFECVERGGLTLGWIDLILRTPARHTVVCGIFVDLLAAARNDASALTYPAAARALFDAETAAAMSAFLVPQIRLLTRRRTVPLEEVMRFAPASAFERARANGEPGAAPLHTALPRLARWSGAIGLAAGATVAIASHERDLGAAVAAQTGTPLSSGSDAPSCAWFTATVGRSAEPAAVSVSDTLAAAVCAPIQVVFDNPALPEERCRTVAIVEPLLIDRPFSNDPNDGPIADRYWVVSGTW
jgi:hypothetical protein